MGNRDSSLVALIEIPEGTAILQKKETQVAAQLCEAHVEDARLQQGIHIMYKYHAWKLHEPLRSLMGVLKTTHRNPQPAH